MALETATAVTAEIHFELDRFDVSDDRQSIELEGRWFGVRGRRFMRPTLTMRAGAEPRRLLADIAHKPWAAEDGELWIASFPWALDAEPVADVELGVAPDIAIALPAPGAEPQRFDVRLHRPVESQRRDRPVDSQRRDRPVESQRRDPSEQSALEAARRENARLRAECDRALAERVAARAERDLAFAERDGARAERDRALAERDAGRAERDRAFRTRDQALDRCEQLVRKTAGLEVDLDAALAAARQPPKRWEHLGRPPTVAAPERAAGWSERAVALAVLVGVLLALVLIAHPV